MHQVLVKRIILSDKKAQRATTSSATPTCLLPGAGYAPRISGKHCGFEVTNINPQFQSGGSHHAKQMTIEQLPLNLPPVFGKIACPIGLDLLSQRSPQLLLAVDMDEFGQLPRSGKNKATNALPNKLGKKKGRLTIRAAPTRFSFIDDRWIPEDKRLATVRRAVLTDYLKRQPHEPFSMLLGIGNSRRATDKLGFGAVKRTKPA